MGVEDGTILDAAMTASSCAENSKPAHGRLNAQACEKHAGAWCPKTNDKAQFLQIDLGEWSRGTDMTSRDKRGHEFTVPNWGTSWEALTVKGKRNTNPRSRG